MTIIGYGLSDDDDAALHRLMLQYVGAFSYLQQNIDDYVKRFLADRSPAVAKVLLPRQTNYGDRQRVALLIAILTDAGYELDRAMIRTCGLVLGRVT